MKCVKGLRRSSRLSAARDALEKPISVITVNTGYDTSDPKRKRSKVGKKVEGVIAAPVTKHCPPPTGISRYHEQQLWLKGFEMVAGVDEAGRGPLAGPVVAAACVIPPSVNIAGINDSKALTTAEREELYDQITSHPSIIWAV